MHAERPASLASSIDKPVGDDERSSRRRTILRWRRPRCARAGPTLSTQHARPDATASARGGTHHLPVALEHAERLADTTHSTGPFVQDVNVSRKEAAPDNVVEPTEQKEAVEQADEKETVDKTVESTVEKVVLVEWKQQSNCALGCP